MKTDRHRKRQWLFADHFCYTLKEPVGPCVFITPWNSPLMLVGWKLAPALAAGCTVVIKPSEFTSASLLEFMKLVVEEAGVPPGVIPTEIFTRFADTGGKEEEVRVPLPATPGLAAVKEVVLTLGAGAEERAIDLTVTQLRFAPVAAAERGR